MSLKWKRFGDARKTKGNVFPDLKVPLGRCLPDLHRFLEELPIPQSFLPADIGHGFGPALPGPQQVPGQVRCDAEHPGLQRGFPSERIDPGVRFEIRLLHDILSILDAGGHSQEEGLQFPLKGLELAGELIDRHFCFFPAFSNSIIS
jgi:hypothetical protein